MKFQNWLAIGLGGTIAAVACVANQTSQAQSIDSELFENARLAIRTSNAIYAQKLLERAAQSERVSPEYHFLAGRVYQEQRRNVDALASYSLAIFLQPSMAKAYINRSLVRGALMDFEGAIQDLDKALSLEPKNESALINRGVTYASLNKPRQALDDLNKAIAINPKLADAYRNRGIVRHLTNEKVEACKDWRQAGRLGSDEAKQWFGQLCRQPS